MELHFFKEFLMISHPTTVFLLLVFLLILAMIHHLEKKVTSYGIPLSAAGSSTSSVCLLSPWSLLPSSTSSFI